MFRLTTGAAMACALVLLTASAAVAQEKTVMVGGAAMYPSKDIIDNALISKDHTNAAFAALPAGTVDTLLKPENKALLTKILTYHVVPGKMDAKAKSLAIKDEKGGMADIAIADVYQSNGVIHVISSVAMPN
ncbi:MAG: fasciclin domain-containing protein [Acidobacteria bacterium]|nr:fasciclin domain-containing protein [Acidobacteriota bacterium]